MIYLASLSLSNAARTQVISSRLLNFQVGTPPEDTRAQLGTYLPGWFGNALGTPHAEVEVVQVFEGE